MYPMQHYIYSFSNTHEKNLRSYALTTYNQHLHHTAADTVLKKEHFVTHARITDGSFIFTIDPAFRVHDQEKYFPSRFDKIVFRSPVLFGEVIPIF